MLPIAFHPDGTIFPRAPKSPCAIVHAHFAPNRDIESSMRQRSAPGMSMTTSHGRWGVFGWSGCVLVLIRGLCLPGTQFSICRGESHVPSAESFILREWQIWFWDLYFWNLTWYILPTASFSQDSSNDEVSFWNCTALRQPNWLCRAGPREIRATLCYVWPALRLRVSRTVKLWSYFQSKIAFFLHFILLITFQVKAEEGYHHLSRQSLARTHLSDPCLVAMVSAD